MAILTADEWASGSTNSVSGADLVAAEAMCAEVSELIAAMCYPVLLEPLALTLQAFDAPVGPVLTLPRPVRSVAAVYVRHGANGDSAALTAADLLRPGTDYYLPIDDVRTQTSRAGRLLRRGSSSVWGLEVRYPPERLGYALEANVGAVFVSGQFGPASVHPVAQAAARAAVSLLFARRKGGAPLGSESWGGYSYSVASSFTATAAVNSPEVLDALRAAGLLPVHIGG